MIMGGLWTVAYAMRQGKERVRRRDQLTPVRAGRTGKSSSKADGSSAGQGRVGEDSRQTGDVSLCWGEDLMCVCDDETSVWEDETARGGGCGG